MQQSLGKVARLSKTLASAVVLEDVRLESLPFAGSLDVDI